MTQIAEPQVRLTPLETAVGMPIGDFEGHSLARVRSRRDAARGTRARDSPALQRPPCMVDFSGGRDSSAVLAVATRVARREGLPLPIPATNLFPTLPDSQEAEWQELVIRHLGLEDWQRRTFDGEFDLLGPLAKSVMSRHGLLAPATSYNVMPALADAAGGTSLTGVDGDGLLDTWSYERAWNVIFRRIRPQPRDVLRIAKAAAPMRIRRPWLRFRDTLGITWLRPEAKAAVDRAWADWWAAEPSLWDKRVAWWAGSRLITVVLEVMDLMAQDAGATVLHPLLDPRFLAALSHAGGHGGFGNRTGVMHALFVGLLPPEVLSRPDKADFTLAYWGEDKRFATEWDGQGLPTDLVDVEELRLTWTSDMPDMRSGLLLQAAWLASTSPGGGLDKSFNCRLK